MWPINVRILSKSAIYFLVCAQKISQIRLSSMEMEASYEKKKFKYCGCYIRVGLWY